MKRATVTFQAVLGMLTTTALLMAGGPPEFEITRSTIDGGGVMRSTGDDLELSGTIGQSDAGVMTGDDFELTGGFWFGLSPTDCNEDGGVNLLDYSTFEPCLAGPDAGVGEACECFDVNRSGAVDLIDFAVAQAAFMGS